MAIRILKPGLQTTIQDSGRHGWMHLGIALSGAMDPLSAKMANYILGNPEHQPVLEMTQTGIDLEANEAIDIVICGARMVFELNGEEITPGEKLTLKTGDQLRYIKTLSGFRTYMAFSRALDVPAFLGSYATQLNAGLGGYQGRALKAGDKLCFAKQAAAEGDCRSMRIPEYSGHYQLRYTAAPESEQFAAAQEQTFLSGAYQVRPELNRMGIRLSGTAINFRDYPHMASRGLIPGTVQIPPDGQPIIAGMDAQTTGGYLRMGQIIRADMPIVGQLKPGDSIRFRKLELAAANHIFEEQQKLLDSGSI